MIKCEERVISFRGDEAELQIDFTYIVHMLVKTGKATKKDLMELVDLAGYPDITKVADNFRRDVLKKHKKELIEDIDQMDDMSMALCLLGEIMKNEKE